MLSKFIIYTWIKWFRVRLVRTKPNVDVHFIICSLFCFFVFYFLMWIDKAMKCRHTNSVCLAFGIPFSKWNKILKIFFFLFLEYEEKRIEATDTKHKTRQAEKRRIICDVNWWKCRIYFMKAFSLSMHRSFCLFMFVCCAVLCSAVCVNVLFADFEKLE